MTLMPGQVKGCWRKVAYFSFDTAHAAARDLAVRYRDTPMNPYRCPSCQRFHLTKRRQP